MASPPDPASPDSTPSASKLCDFCALPAVYDARTLRGSWAFVCESDFERHTPKRLGLGWGQRLNLEGPTPPDPSAPVDPTSPGPDAPGPDAPDAPDSRD